MILGCAPGRSAKMVVMGRNGDGLVRVGILGCGNVGTALVRFGLAYARERGLIVAPICPFFADYIRDHPEDQDLLDPAWRKKLGLPDANGGWLRSRFDTLGVTQFEDWVDTGEEYGELDEVSKDRAAAAGA